MKKKNKVRAFPRERSREWRENVSICRTESDFFEVHLPSFILEGYSPSDSSPVCDFLRGRTSSILIGACRPRKKRGVLRRSIFRRKELRSQIFLGAPATFRAIVPSISFRRDLQNGVQIIIHCSLLLYFPCVTLFGKYEIHCRSLNIQSMSKALFLREMYGEKNCNKLNLKIAEIFLNKFLY